jgi:hypothetical protein
MISPSTFQMVEDQKSNSQNVSYRYATCFLTIKYGLHKLPVFENKVTRKIFGPKKDEEGLIEQFRCYISINFVICTYHLLLLR